MDYKDLQEVLNKNALDDVERIKAEERLNNCFNRHEDAVAFIEAQKHPDKLFVKQKENGKFTVQPLVLLDINGLPIQDGDILFEHDDSYYTVRIKPYDDRRLGFELSWERDGKQLSSEYLYDKMCQHMYDNLRHHRWSNRSKNDFHIIEFNFMSAFLSPLFAFLALIPLLMIAEEHHVFFGISLIIAVLFSFVWLISVIFTILWHGRKSKMVKQAVKTAAVLYLDSSTVTEETEGA